MLPTGFQWQPRYQYAKDELALKLGDETVAMLMQDNHGGWYARLWCHWAISEPVVTRPCSSFEAGRAGIEAWAVKHEARLREEVGRKVRPVHRGVG